MIAVPTFRAALLAGANAVSPNDLSGLQIWAKAGTGQTSSAFPIAGASFNGAGANLSAPSQSSLAHGTGHYRLGLLESNLFPLGGAVTSAGYWNRVLSSSDRTTLYNSGTPLRYADLSSGMKANLASWLELNDVNSITTDQADGT